MKAKSIPASLTFKGKVTKHTTVKWSIISKYGFCMPYYSVLTVSITT